MSKKECIDYKQLSKAYLKDVKKSMEEFECLKELDIFVMDNSIRESTVGSLKGHSIENKWQIYSEVKKLKFKHIIVASFSHMTRVDDLFIKQLVEKGEDRTNMFGFSEITDGVKNKAPILDKVPVGCAKMKGILYNCIFEVDLGDIVYDFDKYSMDEMCQLMETRIRWCHENLHKDSKIFVSFRDLPDVLPYHPERVFQLADFLCKLPKDIQLTGLAFEEPTGNSLPNEVAEWSRYLRLIMDRNGWKGNLLIHCHEKYGFCDFTQYKALANGCDGIWASVCDEGAFIGAASSCMTLTNLIRMGNEKVLDKFNCSYLRQAAINVTKLSTGVDPHPKQVIYGTRALDFVFAMKKKNFDMAAFFGTKAPARITTMASFEMIQYRLKNLFGEDEQFTLDLCKKMKELMLVDLRSNRREEYMSEVGLAMLFDRAGGKLTPRMSEIIAKAKTNSVHADNLIAQVKEIWNEWDLHDQVKGDNMLEYDSFYNGFLSPYFACYRCSDTKKALQALDMDADGQVDWNEFLVYLKWAMNEYPDTNSTEDLLDIAFRKGLIPAMRDEMIKKEAESG